MLMVTKGGAHIDPVISVRVLRLTFDMYFLLRLLRLCTTCRYRELIPVA